MNGQTRCLKIKNVTFIFTEGVRGWTRTTARLRDLRVIEFAVHASIHPIGPRTLPGVRLMDRWSSAHLIPNQQYVS